MWKRIRRDKFGRIESATFSKQFDINETMPDDAIHQNSLSGNVDVKYTVYTQSEEQFQHEKNDWWEDHYDSYETDSLGLAARELMLRMFETEKKADIKFCLEIKNGISYGETFMDVPWEVIRLVREFVVKGTNKKIDNLERQVESLTEATSEYEDFLRSIPGGMDAFRKWRQERR